MTLDYRIHCLVPDLPSPEEVQPYLQEMHSNRWYSNFGPLVQRFEAQMADFFVEHNGARAAGVASFSSATTALELGLRALDFPKGSKVLVPTVTFPATALAVINAGLEPVFLDVDPTTWELDPITAAEACARNDYVAVIPVATYGRPIEGKGWQAFQEKTGVTVMMDVAAALGQQPIDDGLIYCFSLHATKPFGVGEGGLLVAQDQDMLSRAKSLSNFGFSGPAGVIQGVGTNAKFGEYYAAMGLCQIKRWPELIKRRRRVLDLYLEKLAPLGNSLRLQDAVGDYVPAVLCVHLEGRGQMLIARLAEANIQTRRWYLPPLYEHPALQNVGAGLGNGPEGFAVSEELKASLVGLPFHSFLTEENIDEIVSIIAETAA